MAEEIETSSTRARREGPISETRTPEYAQVEGSVHRDKFAGPIHRGAESGEDPTAGSLHENENKPVEPTANPAAGQTAAPPVRNGVEG